MTYHPKKQRVVLGVAIHLTKKKIYVTVSRFLVFLSFLREERREAMDVPKGEDVHEYLFRNELTDGLPVVPCNESKLRWMLSGTHLSPEFVLGKIPPILGDCTVSSVATNAVMAGCEPKHLRIVIAAVQAMLDPEINLHGLHATTMGATPLIVVNGSNVVKSANLNYKHGVLGSGQNNRANACIGRALKLVLQNCGQAKLGGTESTTIGGPRKFTMCVAENFEALSKRKPAWYGISLFVPHTHTHTKTPHEQTMQIVGNHSEATEKMLSQ